ncbi:MAG: GTPase HflX [Clostridia bacterium]|nr:GTPase HflX [Clostridia bacterium]
MADKIKGNTDGLKAALIREYEQYLGCQCGPGEYVPAELTAAMAKFTGETGREIAFVLDRRNYVREISVGDAVHVDTQLNDGKQRGLSGTRLLHTHPNGTYTASAQDLETLRRCRLDAMVAIGVDGAAVTGVSVYLIDPEDTENALRFGPYSFERLYRSGEAADRVREIESVLRAQDAQSELRAAGREKAVLAGAIPEKAAVVGGDAHALDELAELAETAGAVAVDRVTQRRDRPDVKYYLGSGVVDRIKESVRANRAELVIFDDELSPSQIRNLEDALNVRVIDRTALILDIFAARAQSAEGKLQVELAQQKYRLPRLTGKGIELSRLGGGIGTRGPGESKLETDRRHINRKIHILEAKLKELSARREVLRKERRRNNLPVIAVVGYTNAGKSTLVNALCDADVFVKDELFATLDTSVRRLQYGGDRDFLLVDTVGFIRKLPHDLIESFKATLEETVYADLLLHVVDASAPDCDECIDAVENILDEIGAGGRPRYLVLNKCDRLGEADEVYLSDRTRHTYGKVVRVSALTGEGLGELAALIERYFTGSAKRFELLIPYAEGALIAELRRAGNIEQEDYREDGIRFSGTMPAELLGKFRNFSV